MQDILIRAGSFVAIIILGFILRRVGFFHESTVPVLAKIVINITLPAAIISGFSGKQINGSMLSLTLIGLGISLLYMALAFFLNRRYGREKQAFHMINLSGYNIGNFTLPFVQSFLGPIGVIATSLFDVGNACICLGSSHSVGKLLLEGKGFSLKNLGLSLLKSVPFMCYVIMTVINLARITLPSPILTFAEIIGNANPFLAMFIIGVGFKIQANRAQMGEIVKTLLLRYGIAIIFALIVYFLLPFSLDIRKTLVILAFAPIPSSAPAYISDLKGDVGLASAINSFSIVISIVIIVSLLIATA